MRAGWTVSGPCTRGSTAHPKGATRPAPGWTAKTSMTSDEPGIEGATGERRSHDSISEQRTAGRSSSTVPRHDARNAPTILGDQSSLAGRCRMDGERMDAAVKLAGK